MADDMGAGEVVVRLTVEISKRDSDFLQALADYRNALAKALAPADARANTRLRKRRTRKLEAEAAVAAKCAEMREDLRPMIEACGELPTPPPNPEDKVALAKYEKTMAGYVSRVIAWDKRNT